MKLTPEFCPELTAKAGRNSHPARQQSQTLRSPEFLLSRKLDSHRRTLNQTFLQISCSGGRFAVRPPADTLFPLCRSHLFGTAAGFMAHVKRCFSAPRVRWFCYLNGNVYVNEMNNLKRTQQNKKNTRLSFINKIYAVANAIGEIRNS